MLFEKLVYNYKYGIFHSAVIACVSVFKPFDNKLVGFASAQWLIFNKTY